MKPLRTPAQELHHYQWATATEKKTLFKQLLEDRQANHTHYKRRFVQGANALRPAYLQFSTSEFHSDTSLQMGRAFHEGLLKDEHSTYWIVKKSTMQGLRNLERRSPQNSPQYERLAYLLAQGRANYAEIRLLECSELRMDRVQDNVKNCYVTRLTTTSNLDSAFLPHRAYNEAFAGILTANIFMRKWDQHLKNLAYVGETPVAIDHDMIGPPTTFPHSLVGTSTFNLAFLSFKLITTVSFLRPEHDVDNHARMRLKYHFIRENHREAWSIMQDMIQSLGLGAGLMQAEGLQAPLLRRSIVAFKNVEAIDDLADQAGFQGPERDSIVHYLQQTQKTLGRDIGAVWQRLTGQRARFDDLD